MAWLLAAFLAIVTYTAQLTCSEAGYVLVRDLKLKLDQSDLSKVTRLRHKLVTPTVSLLKVTMKYLKNKNKTITKIVWL